MDRYNKGSTLPLYSTANPKPGNRPAFGLGLQSQFQISGYMMLASLIFWICMGVFAYHSFIYYMMYRNFDDYTLEEPGCCVNFGGSEQDRINFVEEYNKGDAGPYLMRMGPESFTANFKGTPSPSELPSLPTIVTAAGSADFYSLQTLIGQWVNEIKPAHKDARLIVYDLGLYASELELIKTHCQCEVRSFPSTAYPNHVSDFSNYAYRPVIIQIILEEFGSVFWISPTSQFSRPSDLNQLKFRAKRDFFLWEPKTFTGLIAFTNPKMFEYLKESRCCYLESGMVDMSSLVFYRTNTTWIKVMKPWLKCALNKDCIAPAKSRYSGCFEIRSPKTTGCHRYDQSALSIVMERVYSFSSKSDEFEAPRISRLQENYVEFFPDQPWTFTEIFFVTIMPFTVLGGLIFLFLRKRNTGGKSLYRKR